jgi:hypothetical protein
MLSASPLEKFLQIQVPAEPAVQLLYADLDLGAKRRQFIDLLKDFAAQRFLCRLRQGSGLRHRQFERLDHGSHPTTQEHARNPMVNRALTSPPLW